MSSQLNQCITKWFLNCGPHTKCLNMEVYDPSYITDVTPVI